MPGGVNNTLDWGCDMCHNQRTSTYFAELNRKFTVREEFSELCWTSNMSLQTWIR